VNGYARFGWVDMMRFFHIREGLPIQPGLWLVRSSQPVVDVSSFIYEIGI